MSIVANNPKVLTTKIRLLSYVTWKVDENRWKMCDDLKWWSLVFLVFFTSAHAVTCSINLVVICADFFLTLKSCLIRFHSWWHFWKNTILSTTDQRKLLVLMFCFQLFLFSPSLKKPVFLQWWAKKASCWFLCTGFESRK